MNKSWLFGISRYILYPVVKITLISEHLADRRVQKVRCGESDSITIWLFSHFSGVVRIGIKENRKKD